MLQSSIYHLFRQAQLLLPPPQRHPIVVGTAAPAQRMVLLQLRVHQKPLAAHLAAVLAVLLVHRPAVLFHLLHQPEHARTAGLRAHHRLRPVPDHVLAQSHRIVEQLAAFRTDDLLVHVHAGHVLPQIVQRRVLLAALVAREQPLLLRPVPLLVAQPQRTRQIWPPAHVARVPLEAVRVAKMPPQRHLVVERLAAQVALQFRVSGLDVSVHFEVAAAADVAHLAVAGRTFGWRFGFDSVRALDWRRWLWQMTTTPTCLGWRLGGF